MAKFSSLIEGHELADPAEDFKQAARVEQYRVSSKAIYVPAGFRWQYIPLSGVVSVEASTKTVSAGHCVTVQIPRPTLVVMTPDGAQLLGVDKADSLDKMLAVIQNKD